MNRQLNDHSAARLSKTTQKCVCAQRNVIHNSAVIHNSYKTCYDCSKMRRRRTHCCLHFCSAASNKHHFFINSL